MIADYLSCFIFHHSSPCLFFFSYMGIFASPQPCQAHFCLRVFALAIFSTSNTAPADPSLPTPLTQGHFFIAFRERGRERDTETERERDMEGDREGNINQLPPTYASTKAQTCNLGVCPEWESNLQPCCAWNDAPTN